MSEDLTGKVAVITGAASGIGRATAIRLAAEGCTLAISDVDRKGLAETRALIEEAGGTAQTFLIDVTDRDAVYALAQEVDATLGGADIVVNNAGVAHISEVEDLSYDDLEWVMDVDFWGMVYGTKAFLPQLRSKKGGHIVNVSSIFGIVAVPTQSAYNAAKFAIRGFTEALRQELDGTGIHVSCVHPGGIKTNIVRNARLAQGPGAAQTHDELIARFDAFARTSPDDAAAAIVNGIKKHKSRILIGSDARFMDWLQRLFPTAYGAVFRRRARSQMRPAGAA